MNTLIRRHPFSFLLIIGLFIFSVPLSAVDAKKEAVEENADSASEASEASETSGQPTAVELNGDSVEFVAKENKFVATGNVEIYRGETSLFADKVEFFRGSKTAYATGNVVLKTEDGVITGEELEYNFGSMKGDFKDVTIASAPYFGTGEVIQKVDDGHMVLHHGYLTTCDHDKPHFRLASKKLDVYPGDKAVARNLRLFVGKIPVMYIPKYVQNISDKKPRVTYIPGYDKDWGAFLLTDWRYYFDENLKGVVHADYRDRKGFASGFDVDYKLPNMGKGLIRTYYMNERNITSDFAFQEKPTPTVERERFKVEWRHQWQIDDWTEAIWQYYKLSDNGLLKDYFESEFERDPTPKTFFQLTRVLPKGTFSFRTDARVNRFISELEKLPEIQYNLSNQEIGETNLFLKSITTYSNLTKKDAAPSEVRINTMRVDTDDEISYPMKVGFVELRPFVGGRFTYYSKTKDPTKDSLLRGVFKTGADLSTKFYKVWATTGKFLGVEINRLRHIVTPSVSYRFNPRPTVPSSQLDSFDGLDSLARNHSINFSLENKLQTKRDESSIDLLRTIISTDFRLKEYPGSGGFDNITFDIEFKPERWLTFSADALYQSQRDKLNNANLSFYVNDGDKWSFGLERRLQLHPDDDQLTTNFTYRINPKWEFEVLHRFDLDLGHFDESQYTVTRDLHAWEMELNFNRTRNEGDEIWVIFRLKAFPEIGFDAGTSFNRRKTGSQP